MIQDKMKCCIYNVQSETEKLFMVKKGKEDFTFCKT